MVGMVGIEPTKPKQQIYSLPRLTNCAASPERDGSISPMAMLSGVGNGLGDRTRTCGLTLPKRELYQLSYTQFGRSREGNVFHSACIVN